MEAGFRRGRCGTSGTRGTTGTEEITGFNLSTDTESNLSPFFNIFIYYKINSHDT